MGQEETDMTISEAMEVLRRAAIDGRMDVQVIWDFADEMMAVAIQQPGFRPGTNDPDPLDANPDLCSNVTQDMKRYAFEQEMRVDAFGN